MFKRLTILEILEAAGEFFDSERPKEIASTLHKLCAQEAFAFMAGVATVSDKFDALRFERLTAIYDKSSIFVLPSYIETFGFPVLEAMSRGVPVAATRFSAPLEICGDAAVYFDPWCTDEMADAMLSVLADPI